MRAELCGCAPCRERGKKFKTRPAGKPVYYFCKASRERTEFERKQRKARGCLIQGEGEGERDVVYAR